jgi:MoaA/NifB/PqqE/SkfB family radical SAM enzyme
MNIALTNYGLRYAAERFKDNDLTRIRHDAESYLLLDLWTGSLAPYRDQPAYHHLLAQGLIELVPETLGREAVALRYRRNPLEHVEQVIFEYTTRCNFNCRHCYNAGVERVTEHDVGLLKAAVDVLVRMGVRRFAFIGGEVSQYGDGWLELVRHMRSYADVGVALCTNGWWLGQRDFAAAGRRYPDVPAYLADLKDNGLSHVIFSLDGRGAAHDDSRRHPGLYRRILDGFDLVRAAGLEPRVSLLVPGDPDMLELALFLAELAERIYGFPPGTALGEKVAMLAHDPTNILSNRIDIGNAAYGGTGRFGLFDTPDALLYCKAFFRPAPHLTIKANGEIATCRIANAGEGYGNLHRQGLVHILNRLQDQFVFKLHAERRLKEYRRCVDPAIFGAAFDHLCTLRAILTLIARRMEEEAVDPQDRPAMLRINREVARATGHLV